MAPLLVLQFVLVLLLSMTSYADDTRPTLSIRTNETLNRIGEPFIVSCELGNFVPNPNGTYYVYIYIKYDTWVEYSYNRYMIKAQTNPPEITPISPYSDPHVSISPGNYYLTSYEFTVVPKITGLKEIQCYLGYYDSKNSTNNFDIYTPYTNVSTFTTLPPVVLSTNVSQLQIGEPFTATCTIRDSTLIKEHYQIHLYNERDGLLGSYEVKVTFPTPPPLLKHKSYPNTTVHYGQVVAFPRFDFEVQEKVDPKQAYWCVFEDLYIRWSVSSKKWSNGPLVQFISTKTSSDERKGSCQIGNEITTVYDLNGKEYSVNFFGQLNGKGENLLAKFIVKANQREEFESEQVDHWTAINAGEHTTLPNFELLTSMDGSFDGEWWCTVEVGVKGQAGYLQFKSNRVAL